MMFDPYEVVKINEGQWVIKVWIYTAARWYPWHRKYVCRDYLPTDSLEYAAKFQRKLLAEVFASSITGKI
jgi:hypothetical protein